MTVLVWDQVGERVYQTGVDRGVLYLEDGTVAVWNGLTGVEESPSSESKSFYLDGRKYLENLLPGDFSAKLKAFTYPEEFDSVNGIVNDPPGLAYYDQPAKSFNLCYRTQVGNDLLGSDYGYKLHLLYHILANPDVKSFATLDDSSAQPVEFSWTLSGTPVTIAGLRPTAHVSVDSTKIASELLQALEDILYGTESDDPSLPTIEEIAALLDS